VVGSQIFTARSKVVVIVLLVYECALLESDCSALYKVSMYNSHHIEQTLIIFEDTAAHVSC